MNTNQHDYAARDRDGMAQIGPSAFQMRGIRFIDGEDGAGTPPAPPAAPAPQPPAPPAPAAQQVPPTPNPPAPTPPPVNYQGNPDEYVRQLREESRERREALTAEQAAHNTVKSELATAQAALADQQRTNAVLRLAGAAGANATALLDSTSFMTALAAVDISKDDDVTAAITTALGKNSALSATPTLPSTNGGGHQGGSTEQPKSLEGAIAAHLGG